MLKSFSKETKIAIKAAKKAGREIFNIYNKQSYSLSYKAQSDPVTEADFKSHDIIKEILAFFDYPIISEESSENLKNSRQDKTWIIDPLDGTKDFIKKTGEFSVMIALVEKNIPILGVVYQPVGELLYVAEKNKGSFLEKNKIWQKLKVSNIKNLAEVKAVVSRSHLTNKEKNFIKKLKIKNYTPKGSCGIKIASICEKKADLYFTFTDKIKQWDTAAAHCIIEEAGGKMTNILGDPIKYTNQNISHKKGLLVTNKKIHHQVIDKYEAL